MGWLGLDPADVTKVKLALKADPEYQSLEAELRKGATDVAIREMCDDADNEEARSESVCEERALQIVTEYLRKDYPEVASELLSYLPEDEGWLAKQSWAKDKSIEDVMKFVIERGRN